MLWFYLKLATNLIQNADISFVVSHNMKMVSKYMFCRDYYNARPSYRVVIHLILNKITWKVIKEFHEFSWNVDNETRNRWLNIGNVTDFGETLTFDLSKSKGDVMLW